MTPNYGHHNLPDRFDGCEDHLKSHSCRDPAKLVGRDADFFFPLLDHDT